MRHIERCLKLCDRQLAQLIERGEAWPWNGYELRKMKEAEVPRRRLSHRSSLTGKVVSGVESILKVHKNNGKRGRRKPIGAFSGVLSLTNRLQQFSRFRVMGNRDFAPGCNLVYESIAVVVSDIWIFRVSGVGGSFG